ncbi:hypothetical protein AHMF7605_22305 [Adhaeribacter arboris]|uniref:Uncharacterized protein n=1 Tax=Adhaeribacter arboris TaxID=2072846 RepID=A0A2T2YKJ3_9BACT|nr:hypothetical protein [Adhaeribacter arboris]PSR56034.1 hypothetical protein AHMF7605_22305 [Adhaeribacter arboris]
MNNKTLGIFALIGAPALLIGTQAEQTYPALSNSWLTGIWGIVYISAWMASMLALRRIEATGNSQIGKRLLWVIISTLTLANISNVYQLLAPQDKSILFMTLDSFWPISNLVMLIVGISIIKAKVLPSWKRYVPLVVGLWFPLTMLIMALVGRDAPIMVFVPYYSAVAWSLLAIVVLTVKETSILNKTAEAGWQVV